MCAQMKRLADRENREERDHSYFPEEVREKLDIEQIRDLIASIHASPLHDRDEDTISFLYELYDELAELEKRQATRKVRP